MLDEPHNKFQMGKSRIFLQIGGFNKIAYLFLLEMGNKFLTTKK